MPTVHQSSPAAGHQRPKAVIALLRRGRAQQQAGQLAEATRSFEAANAALPTDPDVALILAQAYGAAKKWEPLLAVLDRVSTFGEGQFAANAMRADALRNLGRTQEALFAANALCSERPEDATAWSNLGAMLTTVGQHEVALRVLQRALTLAPHDPSVLLNNAEVMLALNEPEIAYDCLTLALEQRPTWAQARLNRALIGKRLGKWETAWDDFEARFDQHTFPLGLDEIPVPRWRGQSLAGRRLLLYPEQGLGDELTFVRYVEAVRARGARILLRCAPALTSLFRGLPGVESLTERGSPVPDADYSLPLLSVPQHLGVRDAQISGAPYLAAQGACPTAVRQAFDALPRGVPRIGLVWFGSPAFKGNADRSIGLAALRPLLARTNVHFVSLQMGDAVRDLDQLTPAERSRITDLSACLTNMNDTAHALSQLDLLIGSDTSVPNLAGALGVRTWVLVTTPCDFRWQQRGDTTPWYDSVRVFRQTVRGNWGRVITDIGTALDAFVPARTTRPAPLGFV
jgi:Flp pilus assembly protein TadD